MTQEDKNSIQGDLDHFDESLKTDKAWSWDNFFVVATHVNCRIKGSQSVDSILKPDDINYDPNKYLAFDFEAGVFIAKITLSAKIKTKVVDMIEILGINCVAPQRKKYLQLLKTKQELLGNVTTNEYSTAWSMM